MPAWTNWSGNIEAPIGNETYLVPTSLSQLQGIVAGAAKQGVTLRVSGQRHSQSPLVASDSRGGGSAVSKKAWLVDLSCYADLGPKGDQRIVLDPSGKKVTVTPASARTNSTLSHRPQQNVPDRYRGRLLQPWRHDGR